MFDPDRGCRLATYAAYWIPAPRSASTWPAATASCGSALPSERRALRIYRKTHEKDPEALAEMSGLTEERATELLPLLMAPRREPGALAHGRRPRPRFERLADDSRSPEERRAADERAQLQEALKQVVAELSPREQNIVKQRWLTDEPQNLEELGAAFGVSKERVRQFEERAKKRMRERLEQIVGEPIALTA